MEDEPRPRSPEALALRRLQSAMAEADAALARRMRMHPTDLAAMGVLSFAAEPTGPSDLAHRLGLSPAATTELVDRLTAAGHVERHRDLADRRRIRLEASDSAVATVLGEIGPLIAAVDAAAAERSPEERAVILDFLDRVTEVYARWAGVEED
jgi:DNA-binding MarR family transcriptional regulator